MKLNLSFFFSWIKILYVLLAQIQRMGMGYHFDHKQEYRRAWLHYAIACILLIIVIVINCVLLELNSSFEHVRSYLFDVLHTTSSMIIPTTLTILLGYVHKRFVLLNLLLRLFILCDVYFNPPKYIHFQLSFLYATIGIISYKEVNWIEQQLSTKNNQFGQSNSLVVNTIYWQIS